MMDIIKEKDGAGFWDYLVILLVIASIGIIMIIATDFFSSESVSQDSLSDYEKGYNDAERYYDPLLYKGSNSYLLEENDPYTFYWLKNSSSDLVDKQGNIIDSLSCTPNSCDRLNSGSVCLQCDYNVLLPEWINQDIDFYDSNTFNLIDSNAVSDLNWNYSQWELDTDLNSVIPNFEDCEEVRCDCHEWGCLLACYLCPEGSSLKPQSDNKGDGKE